MDCVCDFNNESYSRCRGLLLYIANEFGAQCTYQFNVLWFVILESLNLNWINETHCISIAVPQSHWNKNKSIECRHIFVWFEGNALQKREMINHQWKPEKKNNFRRSVMATTSNVFRKKFSRVVHHLHHIHSTYLYRVIVPVLEHFLIRSN